ncbi:MAG: ATP-binding cassette domain-containing protein [Saprospirales bacterium]|nr:ATP-binding cassette domain-containing protein [Saprospirales bacterium]MBK6904663.1 ATP-binding cassette domain-containing protein [Saprospirales bacterium]MBK7336298.1 ATP-binding cassette domain-containing protein [Saprospirales bacterium]
MTQIIARLRDVDIYQKEQLVLSGVNLTLNKGEFVYLIGKTGSGKSSLLKTIYAALPLTKGKGEVAGFDLGSLTRKTIPLMRRKLGIVFQDYNLLMDRRVGENLQFILEATGWKDKAARQTRVDDVLEQVGLKEFIHKMPNTLSGGEQQRVVIARALLNSPELIIADEPTGNLDPETSDDILLLLRQLSQKNNTAIMVATHDYRMLENFPARIVRCHAGKVMEEDQFEL